MCAGYLHDFNLVGVFAVVLLDFCFGLWFLIAILLLCFVAFCGLVASVVLCYFAGLITSDFDVYGGLFTFGFDYFEF